VDQFRYSIAVLVLVTVPLVLGYWLVIIRSSASGASAGWW